MYGPSPEEWRTLKRLVIAAAVLTVVLAFGLGAWLF